MLACNNIKDTKMDVSPDILAARAKLRERFGTSGQQMGGKGTARRKQKKVHKSTVTDEKKLNQALKRVNANSVPGIEDVQIIKADGKVLQFTNPKVQASTSAHTYVVSGPSEEKDFSSMLPQLLQQLGNSGLPLDGPIDPNLLKKLQGMCVGEGEGDTAKAKSESDDDVPTLATNFEDVSKE